MTKESFLEELQVLNSSDEIGLQLFFLLANGQIKKVDLEDSLIEKLKSQFISKISGTFNNERHFVLKSIQELGDESLTSEYYYFDNDNIHDELEFITDLVNDTDGFEDFIMTEDKYKNVQALLIKIGTADKNVILYKHHYAINVLKKAKTINMFKSGDTFKEVNDDIFKIDINFDLLLVNNHIVINKMKTLENRLGYRERILTIASAHLEVISALNFIQDMEHLETAIKTSRWAKKLNKVQNSPVLNIIENDQNKVIEFIRNHPSLNSIPINGENKLELTSQRAVERFLKLLDDDYLYSQLTETQYDTNVKNTLE